MRSSESAKVLQAAGPPVGFGPSSRDVVRGLRQLRPPVPVLVAGVLMAVPVLALAVATVTVLVKGLSAGAFPTFLAVLFGIALSCLAGLGWRGAKRTIHLGAYDDGLFLARLSLVGLALAAAAVVALMAQGKEPPPGVVLLPAVVAVLWAPWLLLQNEAAREWPGEVGLRRGVSVADAEQAARLPGLRPHACGAFGHAFPARAPELIPAHDRHGSGWRVRYTCGACGGPAEQLGVARRPGEPSALGASDLWWLGEQADEVCQSEPTVVDGRLVVRPVSPAALDDQSLAWCVTALHGGVLETERLLSLVPEGGEKVPGMRTGGRPVPAGQVTRAFQRGTIERALSRRREWLGVFEAEAQRRSALVPRAGA